MKFIFPFISMVKFTESELFRRHKEINMDDLDRPLKGCI